MKILIFLNFAVLPFLAQAEICHISTNVNMVEELCNIPVGDFSSYGTTACRNGYKDFGTEVEKLAGLVEVSKCKKFANNVVKSRLISLARANCPGSPSSKLVVSYYDVGAKSNPLPPLPGGEYSLAKNSKSKAVFRVSCQTVLSWTHDADDKTTEAKPEAPADPGTPVTPAKVEDSDGCSDKFGSPGHCYWKLDQCSKNCTLKCVKRRKRWQCHRGGSFG